MTPIAILRQGRKKRAQNEFSRFPRCVPTAKWAGTTHNKWKLFRIAIFRISFAGKTHPTKASIFFPLLPTLVALLNNLNPACCPIKYSFCGVCSSVREMEGWGGAGFFSSSAVDPRSKALWIAMRVEKKKNLFFPFSPYLFWPHSRTKSNVLSPSLLFPFHFLKSSVICNVRTN